MSEQQYVGIDLHRRRSVMSESARRVRTSRPPGQYTSYDFARACRAAGVERSMGSVGDCYDAMAESFFATLECELLDRTAFENRNAARMSVFDFIDAFYNPWRRHSSIGNLSPAEYERRWHASSPPREAA